jgi:hypothetical protein
MGWTFQFPHIFFSSIWAGRWGASGGRALRRRQGAPLAQLRPAGSSDDDAGGQAAPCAAEKKRALAQSCESQCGRGTRRQKFFSALAGARCARQGTRFKGIAAQPPTFQIQLAGSQPPTTHVRPRPLWRRPILPSGALLPTWPQPSPPTSTAKAGSVWDGCGSADQVRQIRRCSLAPPRTLPSLPRGRPAGSADPPPPPPRPPAPAAPQSTSLWSGRWTQCWRATWRTPS